MRLEPMELGVLGREPDSSVDLPSDASSESEVPFGKGFVGEDLAGGNDNAVGVFTSMSSSGGSVDIGASGKEVEPGDIVWAAETSSSTAGGINVASVIDVSA